MALPAMLRLSRLSAVTAIIAITMPMTRQRIFVGFRFCTSFAASGFSFSRLVVFKRLPYSKTVMKISKRSAKKELPWSHTMARIFQLHGGPARDRLGSRDPRASASGGFALPDQLQSELNLSGRRGCLV